ncbi:MAG: hypothetical protein ACFBSD_12000 [Paracoccaceae bacterium]
MSDGAPDDRERQFRARRLADRAAILPVLGTLLLMPPVAQAFAVEGRLFGVPIVILYVFVVWGALILLAARLAGRLRDAGAPEDEAERPG